MFEFNYRNARITLAVFAMTVGFYSSVGLEISPKGGAQSSCALAMYYSYRRNARKHRIVKIFIYDKPSVVAYHTSDVNL